MYLSATVQYPRTSAHGESSVPGLSQAWSSTCVFSDISARFRHMYRSEIIQRLKCHKLFFRTHQISASAAFCRYFRSSMILPRATRGSSTSVIWVYCRWWTILRGRGAWIDKIINVKDVQDPLAWVSMVFCSNNFIPPFQLVEVFISGVAILKI